MNHRKGIMMVEILLSLFIASLVLVSAGRAIHAMNNTQNRTTSRWHALLACRSILEYSTIIETECDTVVISGGDEIHVRTVLRPLSRGTKGFSATASWVDPTSGSRKSIQLGRIVLSPHGRHNPGIVHEFE